jgi:hypothetical protein
VIWCVWAGYLDVGTLGNRNSGRGFCKDFGGDISLFMCSKCKCVENTATSNWMSRKYPDKGDPQPLLCSECDPEIGKWHGRFPKQSAKGFLISKDGFLYSKEDKVTHTKIVGEVTE